MSSGPELERFLADLGRRRERVLKLADPSGPRAADLVAELNELSQQLLVADEELRVQQEELERTRDALVAIGARRDLLDEPDEPCALTDPRGVVVMSTPAVQRLTRQPSARLTLRPIATWFDVPDRQTVRGMIGRITAVGERRHAEVLYLRTGDGERVPVRVSVEGVADPLNGRLLLRWEVSASETSRLQVVADADTTEDLTVVPLNLPLQLADAAAELNSCADIDELISCIAAAADRLLPEADGVGVVVRTGRRSFVPRAATSEVAAAADVAQLAARSGPTMVALTEAIPVRMATAPWLSLSLPRDQWPVAVMSIPLVSRDRTFGALTCYAARAGAFTIGSQVTAAALGGHAMVALGRLTEMTGFREALQSRQLIGQAVGVLVERHRVTAEEAFEMLVQRSQETNLKLRDIARVVAETGQDPGQVTAP